MTKLLELKNISLYSQDNIRLKDINLTINDSVSTIQSPFDGTFMRMADQFQGTVVKDSLQPLMYRSLYNAAGMQFVFPDQVIKGEYGIVEKEVKTKNDQDAIILDVTANGETKQVKILGGVGHLNDPKRREPYCHG